MADYTLGTPLTVASYTTIGVNIIEVSNNLVAAVWIRDSDDYSIAGTYSLSNGIWTLETGLTPLFTGDAWYSNTRPTGICKIANERILFLYAASTSFYYTRLVNTSASTITDKGSKDLIGESAAWGSIDRLDDNKAIFAYKRTSDNKLYAKVITIAGDVQSVGSSVEMSSQNSSSVVVKRISSTNKFVIFFDDVTNSKISMVIGTVSGTVITPGSVVDVPTETGCTYSSVTSLDDDKFICTFRSISNKGKAIAVTVSGTVPTIGPIKIIIDDIPANNKAININSTSFMNIYNNITNSSGEVIKCNVDWGTRVISIGTAFEWISNNIGGISDLGLDFCYIDENYGATFYQDQGDSDYGKLLYIQSNIIAPLNVAAVSGGSPGEIDISFDSVSGADSYNIYWSYNPGVTKGTGTKITGVTSPYTHSSLTLYQEHFYVVTAVDNGYETEESLEVSAYPLVIDITATIVNGDSENILSWNDVSGATSYDIYWGLSSGVTISTGTKIENVESPYNHIGLTRQTYYYIVVANAGAFTYISNEVSAKPDFEGKIFNHNEQIKLDLLYQYKKN